MEPLLGFSENQNSVEDLRWLLLGALLRLFTIQQGIARAGLRFGLKAKVVPMSEGEACIDADKPADIVLIEKIFDARAAI